MKIQYRQTIKHTRMRDMFNVGIAPGVFEADEFDYIAYITLFGREWHWYINK